MPTFDSQVMLADVRFVVLLGFRGHLDLGR